MRKKLAFGAGVLILLVVNWVILGHERLLKNGQVVLLELAPVDPRSLMQGDYMALRYSMTNQALERVPDLLRKDSDGRMVVKLDEHNVAGFVRLDNGTPLSPGEKVLRFRIRNENMRFATNAYFFEEGSGDRFTNARYGEFRVSPSGDLLLTHLINEKFERLGQSSK